MKLSEKLQRDHECGDFGKALAGYSEEAAALERKIEGLEIGSKAILDAHWGYAHNKLRDGSGKCDPTCVLCERDHLRKLLEEQNPATVLICKIDRTEMKPGEVLLIQAPESWSPDQVRNVVAYLHPRLIEQRGIDFVVLPGVVKGVIAKP